MPHRYFTAEVGNGRAALNGTDAHHLADVMRAKIGENVILCDAHAVEYVGTITSIQPGRVEFTVTEGYPSAAEPSVEVTLFAGYPKLGKLEDTIRHSVELGVTNVVPFFSRYCVAAPKKEEAKNERYCRVAVEAAATLGWHKYVGLDGAVIGLDHFGASAPYKLLFQEYGFTAENVAATAKKVIG